MRERYSRTNAKEYARAVTHGIWAAITTPFDSIGEVDEAGLRRNVRYLIDELEIDGIFCCGSMGEFWSLGIDERRRVAAVVVDEAHDSCLVNVHTGTHSAVDTVALSAHAHEVGADFVSIITPYYPRRPIDGVYEWFKWVCDRLDIGVWLFDGPFIGSPEYFLDPDLADRIAEFDNICGLKIACSLEEFSAFHEKLNRKVVLSNPKEVLFLDLITQFGQQVHMSSAAPYKYQRPGDLRIREYARLAQSGELERAAEVFHSLDNIRDLDRQWIKRDVDRGAGIPVASLKSWTGLLGMAAGPVRAPFLPLGPDAEQELHSDLRAAGLIGDG